MTVSSMSSRSGPYVCDGSRTGFVFDFMVPEPSHLRVVVRNTATGAENELVFGADYGVTGAGSDTGGEIECQSPPSAGYSLTILRNIPAVQEMDLVDNDPFYADVIESAFDRLTMICQQQREEIGRCVKVTPGSTVESDALLADIYAAAGGAVEARDAAQTAQNGAEAARSGAEAAESLAEAARGGAQAWSETPEDVQVPGYPGSYSAMHWALKAMLYGSEPAFVSVQAADPAVPAGQMVLYPKTVSGYPELFARGSGGITQITRQGGLNISLPPFATGPDAGTANIVARSDHRHPVALIVDVKTGHGGTATAGDWRIRDLNTILVNEISIPALVSNQFILPPGSYRIGWQTQANCVNGHRSRLFNTSTSAEVQRGAPGFANSTVTMSSWSHGFALVALAVDTSFRIEHWCETSKNDDGFGVSSFTGGNIFTMVFIEKEHN